MEERVDFEAITDMELKEIGDSVRQYLEQNRKSLEDFPHHHDAEAFNAAILRLNMPTKETHYLAGVLTYRGRFFKRVP